jgi:hypothetical protein
MLAGSGLDNFSCGQGIDTVTDYNPQQGDNVESDCENY